MKTSRLIFAAIFAGALIASCAPKEIEEIVTPEPELTAQTFTLSIEAVKGLDTKALAEGGKTLTATWGADDAVGVCKIYDGPAIGEVIGVLTPETTGSATTTLSGDIETYGIAEGDHLFLQYPYKYTTDPGTGMKYLQARYDDGQDGSLATLAKSYDYATAEVEISSFDGSHISASPAAFENRQAIVKFSLKNSVQASRFIVTAPSLADHFYFRNYYSDAEPNPVVLTIDATAPTSDFYVALYNQNTVEAEAYTLYAFDDNYAYRFTSSPILFTSKLFHKGNVGLDKVFYDDTYNDISAVSVTGSFAAYGDDWDRDIIMWSPAANPGMSVCPSIALKAGDEFKFRDNRAWDYSYCAALSSFPNVAKLVTNESWNIVVPDGVDGVYDLFLDMYNEQVIVAPASGDKKPILVKWSLCGTITDWSWDMDMNYEGNGVWKLTDLAMDAGSAFKLRFGWDWNANGHVSNVGAGSAIVIGEEFDAVSNGGDIVIPAAGKYDITYNETTGKILVEESPAIRIDGKFDDWVGAPGVTGGSPYSEFKVAYDANYFYFYSKRNFRNDYWGNYGYYYYGIDEDNDSDTHMTDPQGMPGADEWVLIYPFGGTNDDPVIPNTPGEGGINNWNTYAFPANSLAGAFDNSVVETEFRIARSLLNPIASGQTIKCYSWGSKSATNFKTSPVELTIN